MKMKTQGISSIKNVRVHGKPPYQTILIHGGPGAAGEMEPVAKELGKSMGVIEPFQTKMSIQELVIELNEVIEQHNRNERMNIIGYSWGAWLAVIFTSLHPDRVKKLVLVSSGPFEECYTSRISETRLSRMKPKDKEVFKELEQKLFEQNIDKDHIFKQIGYLIGKVDSFDPIPMNQYEQVDVNVEIYHRIWQEASSLRKSGELLKLTQNIHCPIVAIHGDYDPHPYAGVIDPLSKTVKSFNFKRLKNCGHTPWKEKQAREEFYRLLAEELF